MDNSLLVANRNCGGCTACCVELTIDDPDLKKLPGFKCKHLTKNDGCSIYQNRPETCRNWYCMWRFLPNLNDDWRPDKKGILIERTYDDIPNIFSDKIALEFNIIADKSVVTDLDFIELIGGYIVADFACYLSFGPPGYSTGKKLLNNILAGAIASRDLQLIQKILTKALKDCIKIPKDRLKIKNGEIITIPAIHRKRLK